MKFPPHFFPRLIAFLSSLALGTIASAQSPSAADYESIQAAINANPGLMIFVPAGDHLIDKVIMIGGKGGGLYGPGRIIQTNAESPIVRLESCKGGQLRDLTLTRAEGQMDTSVEGVLIRQCSEAVLENVRVIDNRTVASAIGVRESSGTQLHGCRVENYKRINIDDRTRSPLYGYAFRCIDGTGIDVEYSTDTLIESCRVTEHHLLPTPAAMKEYHLGQITKRNAVKGTVMSDAAWAADYTDNWHQGSAIVVNSPRTTARTQLIGNQIENAAQGMDLHCDQIIVANNIVFNSFIGMKAMHGARNVIITGNQFIKNDLWSIGLMPGTASTYSKAAEGDQPAQEPNVTSGCIIANNIISDFGYGDMEWVWGGRHASPMRFDHGALPENPPVSEVIIQGNMIYDTGRDQPLVDGVPKREPPRYTYSVLIETSPPHPPEGLHFIGNLFHPGTEGLCNTELTP